MSRRHLRDIDFFTYTTTEDRDDYWSRTVRQDAHIVGRISVDLGITYTTIDASEKLLIAANDRATIRRNTLGAHGAWLLPHYRRHFPGGSRVHLRGNLLETGRSVLLRNHPAPTAQSVSALAAKHFARKGGEDAPLLQARFDEGLERFGYDGEFFGVHPVDLFYIEGRMGRWYSELLNETDVAFDSLMPFNTVEMVEAALAWPAEQRIQGVLFHELINKNFPVLNFYGRNEHRNLYEFVRDSDQLPAFAPSGG